LSSSANILPQLATIWSQALDVETVAPDADFFELGGDSVMVTIMTLQVEEAFDLVIDPALVFEFPTLEQYAAQILALRVQPAA
jgi:acyl carrier protein